MLAIEVALLQRCDGYYSILVSAGISLSFDLYYHSLGTPVGGQFLIYIRALRATLNKTDHSFNSVSLYIS